MFVFSTKEKEIKPQCVIGLLREKREEQNLEKKLFSVKSEDKLEQEASKF